ncbi:hypothetical protein [Actinomadura rugatobispora]|uniref:Pectate lyase superfamily protein domain-containing protein n=1 Tax=Actinomadura rugatobispora TaxID=1994 RepID=A0ABW0ZPY4_9ACTN|nr:hypothetical protein GCM10010200_036590 [Actinomadura rugatobispora]
MTVPYEAPDTRFGLSLETALDGIGDRVGLHEATYGAPFDAFVGKTDDDRLAAAFSYARAQTRPPAIVLGNREYSLSKGPYPYFPGLRLVGSLGSGEREFAMTGPHSVVRVGGSALFAVPAGEVRNIWISGIQFRAASASTHFQVPVTDLANGPRVQDATFIDLAWVGFATVMHARHLRCRIDRTYCNEGTDTQFRLAGSDNYYWLTGGYLSSTKLAADRFYLHFPHMSRTDVGPLYITPEKATGIRIDGGYGGLTFTGTKLDSTGRDATRACQGAAVLITGGRGITFDKAWFFGNAVNPAATGRTPADRGQVFIRGAAADVTFMTPQFSGFDAQAGHTPSTTPAIYATSTARGVRVVAPMAPNGGTKLIQQQTAGTVSTFAADGWSLSVA